jgi:hypothetical protein
VGEGRGGGGVGALLCASAFNRKEACHGVPDRHLLFPMVV